MDGLVQLVVVAAGAGSYLLQQHLPGASTEVGKDLPFLLLPFHIAPGPLFGRTEPRVQLAKAWETGLFGFQPWHYTVGEHG